MQESARFVEKFRSETTWSGVRWPQVRQFESSSFPSCFTRRVESAYGCFHGLESSHTSSVQMAVWKESRYMQVF
ncbi:hypothetical protein AVEN_168011-1 [Araneus ventricosus]|uniref:Uncharacterized protein n=1 Tax=Araneus ventricosus TaxID=182803 RepID=A0A4Y2JT23_ARAVE|nr:hypothetical protein AVEN_168011-1 [Araneus ventricosus]